MTQGQGDAFGMWRTTEREPPERNSTQRLQSGFFFFSFIFFLFFTDREPILLGDHQLVDAKRSSKRAAKNKNKQPGRMYKKTPRKQPTAYDSAAVLLVT